MADGSGKEEDPTLPNANELLAKTCTSAPDRDVRLMKARTPVRPGRGFAAKDRQIASPNGGGWGERTDGAPRG